MAGGYASGKIVNDGFTGFKPTGVDNRGAGASIGRQCRSVKNGETVRIVCQ